VAERPQIVQSPIRGEVQAWRGFCVDHLLPLWVEGGVTYHWMLLPRTEAQTIL
jgi:hypothetical protein